MDIGSVVGIIMIGLCLLVLFGLSIARVLRDYNRDHNFKTQETQETKNKSADKEDDEKRKKLVEQYGEAIVLSAEFDRSFDQFEYGKTYGSIEDYCYLNKKRQEERDAQIKYIKSLSKEELELYLLQKEAINQIYNKYK